MIIAVGSLIAMVVLLVVYSLWLGKFEAWDNWQIIPLGLVFVPSLPGLIGIGVLWWAFVHEWPIAASLNWSITCTIILVFVTIIVGWSGFIMYSEEE